MKHISTNYIVAYLMFLVLIISFWKNAYEVEIELEKYYIGESLYMNIYLRMWIELEKFYTREFFYISIHRWDVVMIWNVCL